MIEAHIAAAHIQHSFLWDFTLQAELDNLCLKNDKSSWRIGQMY